MVIYQLQNIQNHVLTVRSHSYCGIYEEENEIKQFRR